MKDRFVDGNSPLENQRNQLTAIEQSEQARLVEYRKEEDGADKRLNRASFSDKKAEGEDKNLHLVVVPQGHSPDAVVRAQQSQGQSPIFDSPSTVYVDGHETEVLGFKDE
jgi:hypothetical protein